LDIVSESGAEIGEALAAQLSQRGYRVLLHAMTSDKGETRRTHRYELRWHGRENDEGPAELLTPFAEREGIVELRWRMGGPS
jgi:hypothetical protein